MRREGREGGSVYVNVEHSGRVHSCRAQSPVPVPEEGEGRLTGLSVRSLSTSIPSSLGMTPVLVLSL